MPCHFDDGTSLLTIKELGILFVQNISVVSYNAIQNEQIYKQQEIRSVEHGICPIAEFSSP